MTNFKFALLLGRSALLLALMAVLTIYVLDLLQTKGAVAFSPLARVAIVLVCMIIPYRMLLRELLSEIERRTKRWRSKDDTAD